jgi:hypothetical protein
MNISMPNMLEIALRLFLAEYKGNWAIEKNRNIVARFESQRPKTDPSLHGREKSTSIQAVR